MKRRKHGFTLPEILIVLGIVVVLAALLFPLLGRVREKGRQATCQSNLKQLFLGVQHYIQDHDSRQPSFGNWRESMATYIKKSDVFVCPSIPEAIQRPDGITETGEYNFYIGFLNSLVTEQHGSTSKKTLVGINDSALANASSIFVSGDVGVYGFSRQVPMPRPDACGITTGNGQPDRVQTVSTVHSGGGNYLFYDGHVKWMSPESFVQALCDAAQYLQPPFRADGEHLP